jgi:hypothetical protein
MLVILVQSTSSCGIFAADKFLHQIPNNSKNFLLLLFVRDFDCVTYWSVLYLTRFMSHLKV